MNKSQLIAAISTQAELSLTKAEKVLAAALECITLGLVKKDTVNLPNLGSFGVKNRAARKVKNPRTGQDMMIAETVVPYFKTAKNLKETVDTQ